MSGNIKVHFSSKTVEWATPQDLFNTLNVQHGPFDIDVAATAENAKCALYFNETQNGLEQDWAKIGRALERNEPWNGTPKFWMNPPYSELKPWMKKAYEESLNGCRVVCLIPARTDTAAWHEYAMNGAEIIFIRGRLRFGGASNSAPFPSAVVIFDETLRDRKNGPRMVSWDYRRGGLHSDCEEEGPGNKPDVCSAPLDSNDPSSDA